MAGNEINDNNKRGIQGVYAETSDYNAVQTQIDTSLQKIETSFLARVDSCQTSGTGGAKTVSATPSIQMVDGNGNGYQSPSYPALPHYRIQAGIAAIILNPVPGDIGIFSCTKRDSSNVSATSNSQQVPASMRSFSPSDAVMVGTVHTKAPTTWIELKQDNTIVIHAPGGVTIETDSKVTINAAGGVEITAPTTKVNGDLEVTGTIKSDGQITGAGINFNTHVHGGIEPGSSDTAGPH